MTTPIQSIFDVIVHFLKMHPELAPQVEKVSASIQGKSVEDIIKFNEWKEYQNLSTQEVFTKIYTDGYWGKSTDPDNPFFSGRGSHTSHIVDSYIDSVGSFLSSLPEKPSVLDLGCGDFNVGSRLRDFCSQYVACDIVAPLIEHNKKKFKDIDVDFRVLDFIEEEIPKSEIIFLRQVLQHLSNAQILRALPKLSSSCRYLLITEHAPNNSDFRPNLDKPTGPGIRLAYGSGIVLTEAPFNLRPKSHRILNEIESGDGIIRTILYEM